MSERSPGDREHEASDREASPPASDAPVETPDELHLDWKSLAGAVTGAAYRVDDQTTDGFGASTASAAAASILDAGIRAVEQHRRSTNDRTAEAPLDPIVFDSQTLRDLLEFLRHARRGLLTVDEIVQEALMWQQLLEAGRAGDSREAATVAQAVDLLASVPGVNLEPPALTPVEPANELERAMVAAASDDAARPGLWRAVYDGEIILPVVAYELLRPEGANFQFLSVPMGDTPLVLGFATEARFDALLPEGSRVSRVLPLGRDLPKFWPQGHWLAINPGYENNVVLSPWEIAGLPDGGRAELPHPRAVNLEPPDEQDDRLGLLVETIDALPDVGTVCWARVRPAKGPSHAPWQDVLVVTADRSERVDTGEVGAVQAVSGALPAELFPRAIVIGRQAELGHPFIEAAVATGRQIGA